MGKILVEINSDLTLTMKSIKYTMKKRMSYGLLIDL